jgi:hypothetical protein
VAPWRWSERSGTREEPRRLFGGEHTAKNLRTDLKSSPYAPFAASMSPAALYARRWWLEESSPALGRAERRTAARVRFVQRSDGSFGGVASTIRHLYALYLLQRGGSPEFERGLDWLWETGHQPASARRAADGAVYHDLLTRVRRGDAARLRRMKGTPFAPGCAIFTKTSAAIYLAAALGRGREARVQRALRCLDDVAETRNGLWCGPSCSTNLLCAYAAHPDASRGRSFTRAVRAIGRMQDASGRWRGMPFAATFSALASVDLREARNQVKRALTHARRTQNHDGSWGRGPNREYTTFQIVQGLRSIEARGN